MADAAGEIASDLRDRAAQTVDAVRSEVSAGMDAASEKAKETIERARSGPMTQRPPLRIRDIAALMAVLE